MRDADQEIEREIETRAEEIDKVLAGYLPAEEGFQKTVLEAMNYSISAGGKRLRPMLMQEVYRMFGGSEGVIEPFMAAMEMIHNYSLVHDDLPAMDNDMYRRGKKTTHVVYGEAMGILAGDALLNYAYETALTAFERTSPENVPNVIRALSVLAQKAGVYGMVGGQTVDVESEKKGIEVSAEQLNYIHLNKTAALIEASMMIGAILAGANEKQTGSIESVARKVGLAFQIQDDILDVTGDQDELGKPVGSDARNQKVTYVTFEGLDKARRDVEELSDEAAKLLHGLGLTDDFLQRLFVWLIHRRK